MNDWQRKKSHERETEANEFASELLMPEKFAADLVRTSKLNMSSFEELSKYFQTSFLAAAKRFVDLTKEPCALIFFRKDGISYSYASKYFDEQRYRICRGSLDPHSYAYDAARYGNGNPYPSSVDADIWIDTSGMQGWRRDRVKEACVKEQSRYFSRLAFGVSLIALTEELIWN